MDLKPSMFCDVVKLSPEEEEREQKVKERTLRLNSSEVRMKGSVGGSEPKPVECDKSSQWGVV